MRRILSILVILTLCACGGGGGGSASGSSSGTTGNAGTLTGVAAVGAGVSGRVYMLDVAGHSQYVDTTDGKFSFSLAGMQSPVLLKAQWTDAGGSQRLYSFGNTDGVINITPLTHLAVSAAAGTLTPDALYATPSAGAFANLQSALPTAIAHLQSYLQTLMNLYGVTGANPITISFAPNHTGMDALLDDIQVSYASGNVTLLDKANGATLMTAPIANLAAAVSAAGWGAADAARAAESDVAVNSKGVGMVLWTELVNAHFVLKARVADGLDAGVTLSTAGDAGAPHVAWDAAGNAHALWTAFDNNRNAIWTSHYSAASRQWTAPHMLSSAQAVASANLPDLTVDQSGNAIAAWHQGNGSTNHFDGWAAQYSAATGTWSAASMVSDGINSVRSARVAVNASGKGLLAWEQERGDGSSAVSQPADIWVRSVATNGAWGAGVIVNTNAGATTTVYVYGQLALAVNGAGDAAVLWSQRVLPASPMVVQAAMYKATNGWQAATTITLDSSEDCHDPDVALDAAGNAMAVWQQQTAYGAYGGSNRYVAGQGWGTAEHFVDSKLGDTFSPKLAMDDAGNATVAWYRWSPTNALDLMINRYTLGSGWALGRVFAPMGTESAMKQSPPHVASNATGQTQVTWSLMQSTVASWL